MQAEADAALLRRLLLPLMLLLLLPVPAAAQKMIALSFDDAPKDLLVGQDPMDREMIWKWLWVANVQENIASVIDNATPEAVFDIIAQSTPLRRVTTPEEFADAVLFVASPWSRAVTGQNLVVDGGLVRD